MAHRLTLALIAVLLLSACGGFESVEPITEPTNTIAPTPITTPIPDAGEAGIPPWIQDYMDVYGVTEEEARRRLALQGEIGALQPTLMANVDTFVMLYIQNEPEYAVIVLLTEGDESDVLPFVENPAIAEIIRVEVVDYTMEQIRQTAQEARALLDEAGMITDVQVNEVDNTVEVTTADIDEARAILDAGLTYPEAVTYILDEALADWVESGVTVFALENGPTILFPRKAGIPGRPPGGELAGLGGTLVLEGPCLRVESGDLSYYVLWHAGFYPALEDDGTVAVYNFDGERVGRVGREIFMGGSSVDEARIGEFIDGLPLEECPGPYWHLVDIVPLEEQQPHAKKARFYGLRSQQVMILLHIRS